VRIDLIDIIHDMTIGHENVFITIVVVIEEIDSPAEIVIGNFSYTRRNGGIGKKFAVLITIKGVCLVLKVDDGQVEQTVVVVVTKSGSHAGFLVAHIVVSDTEYERDLLKYTISPIPEQKVRIAVVGNI